MKETEGAQEPAKSAETELKAEAKKKKQGRGSLDRIRSAKTADEIDAILSASVQFTLASEGTKRKWQKAADKRRKALATQ